MGGLSPSLVCAKRCFSLHREKSRYGFIMPSIKKLEFVFMEINPDLLPDLKKTSSVKGLTYERKAKERSL